MNLIAQHQRAMHYSFLAKQARDAGDEDAAIDYYQQAADIEGTVADHYFDKPDLEPTRSTLIRSAAFLSLKAGDILKAKKYVFWGAAHATDELMQEQFQEALEIVVAYARLKPDDISKNVDYIYKLRQKSQSYILEPTLHNNSNAVTLEMVSDFSINYHKSLKAYSISQYKDYYGGRYGSEDELDIAATKFHSSVKPILTNAGFGSFKFSIATDFIVGLGEASLDAKLKSNVLLNFHENIFSKDLTDENIETFKQDFTDEEIDQIFRPIFHMRSPKSEYRVAYVDRENLRRVFLSRTRNIQRIKLLPAKTIDKDDIGFLEQLITHKRSTSKGQSIRVLVKEQFKRYSFDRRTNMISPQIRDPFFLNEEIVLNVSFDAETGFLVSFEELLQVEGTSISFEKAEVEFYNHLVLYIRHLLSLPARNEIEDKDYQLIYRLINNPELI